MRDQGGAGGNYVLDIEIVKKRTLWGYLGDDWLAFMKLTISEPKLLPKVRDKSISSNAPLLC
jgi:DNA polymerase delta subunit 1